MSDESAGSKKTYSLFEAFGVELEYMIVHENSLDVAPIADQLLRDADGNPSEEIERGDIAWSNELALHILEMKTNGPVATLDGLAARFQEQVAAANAGLHTVGARLLPTAMHPWMRPELEMRLWPHGYNEVYEAFHVIFNCHGHGWGNLQSTHLNLPFADDEQFGRLHAAIRLLLPILPALAASSPVVEGQRAPNLDHRLETYRHNADRVPSVAGWVIPEAVFTQADYERQILQKIYADLAPYDPAGILRYEWANSRGAIARFDRRTIEIRVLDVQEHPAADIAICQLIARVAQALCEGRWSSTTSQQAASTQSLHQLLLQTIHSADQTPIADHGYLAHFGWNKGTCTAGQLWRHLAERFPPTEKPLAGALQVILEQGPLARRIVTALGDDVEGRLREVYHTLSTCLATGRPFP